MLKFNSDIITINKIDDTTYKYVLKIESTTYSRVITSQEDLQEAIEISIKMIQTYNNPKYDSYIIELQELLI